MEVVKGIYQFSGVSNCYLVFNKEIFLVDTGMPGRSNEIIKFLTNDIKRSPEDVKTIVITHHHFDHTGSLDKLKSITGAKIAVHSADADYLSEEKSQPGSAFMIPLVILMKFIYRLKPVKADIILKNGDIIGDYEVIHTPGHTPGSICLYNPNNKVIFVGDNLNYSKGKIMGPSSRLLPEPEQYKKSMKKLGDLDIEVILPGHGPAVTSDANKKLKEFIDQIS
jgi:hydroxyacylglutathione hydrolase